MPAKNTNLEDKKKDNIGSELVVGSKGDDVVIDDELDFASSLGNPSKKMNKTIFEHLEETIDTNTGEVIQRTRYNVSSRQKTDDHLQLYLASISSLLDMDLSKREYDVLHALFQYILPRNNQILLDRATRKKISKRLGFSEKSNSVAKAISSLSQKKVIIKYEDSYYLSPFHFGKGEFQKIKQMRIKVEQSFDFETGDIELKRSSTATYSDQVDNEDEPQSKIENQPKHFQIIDAQQTNFKDEADGVPTQMQTISVEEVIDAPIEPDEFLGVVADEDETVIVEPKQKPIDDNLTTSVHSDPNEEYRLKLRILEEENKKLENENRQLELKLELARLEKGK